jgi:hypothetical protein
MHFAQSARVHRGRVSDWPCPQLCPQLAREAATVPVVLLGKPEDVHRVAEQVKALAPGREELEVDVWLRRLVGATHLMAKLQLRVLHGPGDVDRNKVCSVRSPCPIRPFPGTLIKQW